MKRRAASARTLSRYPGVIGVFSGRRRRKNRWLRSHDVLCAHVRWKRPLAELPRKERIPDVIGDFETDVIEVGQPTVDTLDCNDSVRASHGRITTITALASYDGDAYLLVAGHGALPIRNNRLVTRHGPSDPAHQIVIDDSGQEHHADVLYGRVGGGTSLDYAILRVRGESAYNFSASAAMPHPVPLRSGRPVAGETVSHFSTLAGRRVTGAVQQFSEASVTLGLPPSRGHTTEYRDVIVVASQDEEFSRDGNSGGLVVDDASRAVGMILGSTERGDLAYVLPISALEHQTEFFSLFFEEQP